MSGIVFFKTQKLEELKKYYIEEVECQIWMDQGDCIIFQNGNFLFGFCQRDKIDKCGIITFYYDTKIEVDRFYEKFKETATSSPAENKKYPIHHFFTYDPEGRMLEFQYFLNKKKEVIY